MRVLILNYEFPPLGGGAGNATAELVRALEPVPGLEVVVVTSSIGEFESTEGEFTRNSTIYYLPIGKADGNIHYQTNLELMKYTIKCFWFLRNLLRTESFDFCHSVMTVPAGINAWLIRNQVPYLISLQGSDVPGYSERFKLLYTVLTPVIKRIWKDAAHVVSNSSGLRDLALRAAPGEVIEVIPNGIDRAGFTPSSLEEMNGARSLNGTIPSRNGKLHIVCVGRLIERKGVWEMLEAMPTVLKAIPNAHLDLVGTGALYEPAQKRIEEAGLGESVTLHGMVPHDELPTILRNSHVFALPSHAEGMSNALLEGMACGLPVVVTDTGGTRELVDGNGVIVRMKDPTNLAEGLIQVLSDRDTWTRMRNESLRVSEIYSWERMTDEYLELYPSGSRQSESSLTTV